MTDTFQRTLTSVVTGVRQIEEFASVLVGAAVEDALLCVARDYGHDYALLRRTYARDIVGRHASGSVTDKTRCRGTTKYGKQCNKRGQVQGYCSSHALALAAELADQKKRAAYKSGTNALAPVSDLTKSVLEKCMGRSSKCMVPTTTRDDVLDLL